jgi:predicted transglutaminase-like cysteine proteinase
MSFSAARIWAARLLAVVMVASLMVAVSGTMGDIEAASKASKLFGTKEIRNKNLKPFPKWTGMLKRYFKEGALGEGDCSSTTFNACHLAEWQQFLNSLEGKKLVKQVKAVNRYLNGVKYITDIRNWGVDDYWATPTQFKDQNGDCEDYAIAKYMSLRAIGFPLDKMRIVVVQDQNLGVAHGILAVYIKGKPYILDNQIKQILPSKKIHHYKPFFSVNEKFWWLHRG